MKIHRTFFLTLLLCFLPATAWANGADHVETGLGIAFWGSAIGCIAGATIALLIRSRTGGIFVWTIGSGLALGLGGAMMSVMANAPFFFPNNSEFAALIAIIALVSAGGGGAVLALLAWGIRTLMHSNSDGPFSPPG